jgi:predicted Ser/Thr protein kinase
MNKKRNEESERRGGVLMPDGALRLTRENVARYIVAELHRGRSIAQPTIYLLRCNDTEFVLKDTMPCPRLVRWTFGRWVIQHEYRVCRRLGDIEGVPHVYGLLDDYAMVMERLEAERLPPLKGHSLTPEFFARLKRLVAAMHARGVAHGDLRRKNVLIGADGAPCIIDFATAFSLKSLKNPLARLLFRHYCRVDDITILKIQKRYLPASLTEQEEARLAATPLYLRAGRLLRKKVYRPLKPRHRKKLWQKLKSFVGLK